MKPKQLFLIFLSLTTTVKALQFNKVIIWGHKLHSHTHSYIHYGFTKAFKAMGYETYWLDNKDDISEIDFSNSLFITEGQVDQKMPRRSDCIYILHNRDAKNYSTVPQKHRLGMQVYTNDCENRNCTKMADCILYSTRERIIYLPWATDLLPHEIDQVKLQATLTRANKEIPFIGSYMGGTFNNSTEWQQFAKAAQKYGCLFKHYAATSRNMEENQSITQNAYLAPAIQGKWQCETGYIPCRIFKNISYGQIGITNNPTVYKLFNHTIVYNPDTYQLFIDAKKRLETITIEELHAQMDFVRDHHTYINRVNCLLRYISECLG